ncbi:GntR family transcriptional regulator [Kibdelosporangium lantanae]|uniref:GntR family transcriptional regulator n=1 Tax=Kibdelosporangium lantanae TaxID=1497396 RepID=A0ABW3M105_9PSEU
MADVYRSKIVSDELSPGDRLPTEQELTEEFSTTRGTVREGLKVLVNEGLIEPARPRGYFVRRHELSYVRPQSEWRPQPVSPEMDRWMEDQTVLGREPTQHISVEIIPPPSKVGERLGIAKGDLVVARRRIRYIDGEPFNLNDSFYPYDLIKGSEILNPADIPRGSNQALADLGYEQVRAIDEVEARMPLPDEANRLQLGPGNPVLVHRVTGFTIDDRPVRCTVNVLIGSKHVMLFERSKSTKVEG